MPCLSAILPPASRFPKLVLLGDFGSGKSSLYRRLTQGGFSEFEDGFVAKPGAHRVRQQQQRPEAAQLTAKCRSGSAWIRLPDKTKALLWDTCSMEQFNRSLTQGYYRGAACVILVADASNLQSVRSLEHWNLEAECYAADAVKILVFSKCDSALADRRLISGDIESYQKRLGCFNSAVVSSKTGHGIDELLEKIGEACQHSRARDLQQQQFELLRSRGSLKPILLAGDDSAKVSRSSEEPDVLPDLDFLKSCC